VKAPPPKPPPAAATGKTKQKDRSRMEANVEKEVDRIIDSQDNEYVLSRPKWAPNPLTIQTLLRSRMQLKNLQKQWQHQLL
jgi:hypothetical protein